MYYCDLESMKKKIETFSHFGDAGHGGITRYALSPEDKLAREEFIARMKDIGAEIRMDDLANIYATIPGTEDGLKEIVMGSHVDSVKNGGNYDGILGVMTAMEVLETVVKENISHRHPLTAMIWTNEEGSEFPPAMMCSGIVANEYLPENIAINLKYDKMMNSLSILDGKTKFIDRLSVSPFKGEKKNRISPDNASALIETHIEQGPILEDAKCDLGVVKCVLGMFNYRLKFFGKTTHAGTFPMPKRKDAFFAAAKALVYLHEEIDKLAISDLVYTTGEVKCHPDVHTCVPDYFDFSLDVRHKDPDVLKKVLKIVKSCEEKNFAGCRCEVSESWVRDTVFFDETIVSSIKENVENLGYSHMYINSGAGHDAQFAAYMIPTSMIFVQSRDGLSHSEDEYTDPIHCKEAADLMLNSVLDLDKKI